ncbi:MAG: tRNA (adenosine(37)-N6)-threonylcarbamoyltransferase complex ATPase subunit type 1 TsaE [Pseudomonadota bacterium]
MTVDLPDEAATVRFGETLALALRRGDMVWLRGDLGAGKTSLARATIRAASGDALMEVPSPTFTLVQTYTNLPFGTLAHADLYRIIDPYEVEELGLEDTLADGVALVEWPEKAQGALGAPSLTIDLEVLDDDARLASISGDADTLIRLNRSLAIRDFLDANDHSESTRSVLDGDASARSYERIQRGDAADLILMNDPGRADGPPLETGIGAGRPYSATARLAEGCREFFGVGTMLKDAGLAAPNILAADLDSGLLLLEDLGRGMIIDTDRCPVPERYLASAETLVAMHEREWPSHVDLPDGGIYRLPRYDRDAMMIEVELLSDWFLPRQRGHGMSEAERHDFNAIWDGLIEELASAEKSLVLRDYHSPNIIWRDGESGTDRIGIIDFQDALWGPSAYDVASLAQDARVDVSAELEQTIIEHYCAARTGIDREAFDYAYSIMAAQRASKILGIFVRLDERDGKPAYLAHLPRLEDYLARSLQHPVLADYRIFLRDVARFDV